LRAPRVPALVALASLAALASPVAAMAKDTKIPITTSNAEAKAAYLKGRDLLEKLRATDARAEFQRAVDLDPKFALGLYQLANTQPSARLFNETIAKAAAQTKGISKGEQLMILAGQAGGQGNNAEQLRLLGELVKLYPHDERAWTQYGNAYFGTQEWAKAIDAFEHATKIDASYSQPYNQMGYSYKFLDKYDQAEAAFKKYVELIPDDPNPHDSYAELLMKRGRFEESIANYRKALAIDPGFASARYGIASDYDLMHKPAEALAEMDAALANAKDDGQRRAALFSRAVSQAHAGDLAAAQAEMDKQLAISTSGRDTLAMIGDLVQMGIIALETGDADGAGARFAAARKLAWDAVTIPAANKANQARLQKFLQGRVALAKGDIAGARKWSDEFAAEANASGSAGQKLLVHELAGQVALAEKQYPKAAAELELSNLLDPYNLYRLSLAWQGAGNADAAKRYAEKARTDNTLTNMNYAFVLRAMGANKQMSSASE
jgi:tetratricopeptide (TPR) repeat protein